MNYDMDIKSYLRFFLMVSIILPAGSIYGVPVKILSLVILLFMMAIYKKGILLPRMIFFNMGIIIFLMVEVTYSYYSSLVPFNLIISQAKDIFIYFLMFTLCLSFSGLKDIHKYLMDTIVISLSIVGFFKLLIIISSIITGVSVSVIVKSISDIFSVALMTYDLDDSSIARINMPSDSLLLVPIYYLVTGFFSGGYRRKDFINFILIIFSVLITMSRYQWATTGLAVTLAILSNLKSKKIILVSLCIVLFSFSILSIDSVQEAIKFRFDSQTVSASDSVRLLQEMKINNAISTHPLLGNGMGYYIPDLIRSTLTLYAYELQIPALVMQLGYFGASVIILMTILPILVASLTNKFSKMVSVWILMAAWLLSAFFNPVLFSSSGGAGLIALYALCKSGDEKLKLKS